MLSLFQKKWAEWYLCAGSGVIGAVLSHLGCILVPMLASASAISMVLLGHMMVVISPLIAVIITILADYPWRSAISWRRVGLAALIALVSAVIINTVGGPHLHDRTSRLATYTAVNLWLGDQDLGQIRHDARAMGISVDRYAQIQIFLASIDADARERLETEANATGQGLIAYVNAMCITHPVGVSVVRALRRADDDH